MEPGFSPGSTAAPEEAWWPGQAGAVRWPWAAAGPPWAAVVPSTETGRQKLTRGILLRVK